MKTLTIVPARLKSERLPNKPLMKIEGKSMIVRTVERILKGGLETVVVATDSQLIMDEVDGIEGVIPVMTSADHTCGTERVLEAYNIVSSKLGEFDLIVNVQGDEPFIEPEMMKGLKDELPKRRDKAEFWTTISDLPTHELADENVAKVVVDLDQNALIFTRNPIKNAFKHTSVYIYTPQFLKGFCALPPSPLEKSYKLEQMRALDHGFKLNCIHLPFNAVSVNTIEDLEKAGVKDYELFL